MLGHPFDFQLVKSGLRHSSVAEHDHRTRTFPHYDLGYPLRDPLTLHRANGTAHTWSICDSAPLTAAT